MISIIVPVYNVEKYLNRCIESLINQTYKNIEIILVNDGSKDNCGLMCDEWAKKDSRIKVIHKMNGGLSEARNVGINAALGEFIGFVDSDDWIEVDMYECLLDGITTYNAQLAVTGINRIYDNGYKSNQFIHEQIKVIKDDDIVKSYLQQNSFSTAAWDKLYRKELFNNRKFPVGKFYEDAPVIYDILKTIDTLVVLGKPHYHYFQRVDSICGQNFSINKMDHFYFSKKIYEDAKIYPQFEQVAQIFWCCKLSELIYSLDESQNKNEFNDENNLLYTEISSVLNIALKDNNIPQNIRFKLLCIKFNLVHVYNYFKKKIVKKG